MVLTLEKQLLSKIINESITDLMEAEISDFEDDFHKSLFGLIQDVVFGGEKPTYSRILQEGLKAGVVSGMASNSRLKELVDVAVEDDYENLIRKLKNLSMPTYPTTDLGNSERFVYQNKYQLRYCPTLNSWFYWNGKRWVEDFENKAYYLARQTIREIGSVEAGQYPDGHSRRTALNKWALKSESQARLRAMVDLSQSDPQVLISQDCFDKDDFLLNCQNGTLDLRTGKLLSFRKKDYITKITTINHDPSAICPTWGKFLNEIFDENEELINYIKKVIGYSLTGSTREQEFYFLYGTGANGKSTFINVIMKLLGSEYSRQTASGLLLSKGNNESSSGEEIAVLAGSRLVSTTEVDEGRRLAESLVKQLSGGDRIRARRLYSQSFEFTPSFKIFMTGNSKPRIVGTDLGIWRRIRLIPFTVTVPPEDQDLDLTEKLLKELPGILNWAIEGCLEWQSEGLDPPDMVIAVTGAYQAEGDVLGAFLNETIIHILHTKTQAKRLYQIYCDWCEANGERPYSMRKFNQYLKERGYILEVGTGNRSYWQNMGVVLDSSLSHFEELGKTVN